MVKGAVDIVAVAEHYGLKPDRRGWCSCPFHGEKTPSFHLYNHRYACFGCGAKGDVLDLVGGLLNIGPLEAVKELNTAFGLGIDLDAPVDTTALAKAKAERAQREQFKRWRNDATWTLTACFYNLWQTILCAEDTPATGVSDDHAKALKYLGIVEYYLNLVCFGDEDEVKDSRMILERIVRLVKEAGMGEKR